VPRRLRTAGTVADLADAVADIYAQTGVLSRVTAILEEPGAQLSGQGLHIAETFCRRAADRVSSSLDQIEHNDDDRIVAIAASPTAAAPTATRSSKTERQGRARFSHVCGLTSGGFASPQLG
jgi:hypothetical protein